MYTLSIVTVIHLILYTGIDDLFAVTAALKNVIKWKGLGLALGLTFPTLQKIDSEKHGNVDDCMMEMLAAWLKQQDKVKQHGVPSWSVLQTALKNIGEIRLADEITAWTSEVSQCK